MTRPKPARWARIFRQLRTEGDTPIRQAFAIALGLFIGCTPFLGLHLPLALLFGTLFRLNRIKVYIASHISNPFVAPLLYATEIQVGGWLRRGTWYTPANWADVRLWDVAGDILLGSVVVGSVAAVAGGVLTYAVVNRRGLPPDVAALLADAASRFIDEGVNAWEFAHGKLRGDPVYLDVVRSGALPQHGTIVDLGCGQGLMLALIASARDAYRKDRWPAGWPVPPLSARLVGVELRHRVAARAARSLVGEATILERNITGTPLPPCEAVLAFDVLHLISKADQDAALQAIGAALVPGGVLILREADAAGGWRFTAVRVGNRLTALVQRKWRRTFHFRTAAQWRAALESAGLSIDYDAPVTGTPFANVTLYARKPATATARA